jgi:hypothetical protein
MSNNNGKFVYEYSRYGVLEKQESDNLVELIISALLDFDMGLAFFKCIRYGDKVLISFDDFMKLLEDVEIFPDEDEYRGSYNLKKLISKKREKIVQFLKENGKKLYDCVECLGSCVEKARWYVYESLEYDEMTGILSITLEEEESGDMYFEIKEDGSVKLVVDFDYETVSTSKELEIRNAKALGWVLDILEDIEKRIESKK